MNHTPVIMFSGERNKPVWQLAADNNKKKLIVNRNMVKECIRVGLL